ncbi:MAG: hypothetical protein L0M05_11200 [Corynebacterium variabile]|uniref:hypothetical protein n=1 Tax=Corynebacterium variabile TaxID=1727 RepID=UPI002648B692|nr:hypothetical protein [Corynebacterium variabile]MDN6845327.1 hypothetical protein [Corynebacterium variabile]
MKKSLLALSTTAVVAIGGAGIAAADEPAGDTPTTTGSITNLPSGDAAGSLESVAGAAKSITTLVKAVPTLIAPGGNVAGVISDPQAFLGATGN